MPKTIFPDIAPGFLACGCAGLAAILIVLPTTAHAADAPRFAGIFGDHAVVQRGQPVHVWGTAAPAQRLTSWAGHR